MRIAILTTDTPHHCYFVTALAATGHECRVFAETGQAAAAYPVAHPFETARETYETDRWFGGKRRPLNAIVPTSTFEDLNEPGAAVALRQFASDVAIVFGTGRLRRPIIEICSETMANLHGGDPEFYRGLDTHLWAIWHRDFGGLVTTLHRVDGEIDNGDVILRRPLPLCSRMQLHELRAVNTEICVELVRASLESFARAGRFTAQPQRHIGRYYSAMPAVLKEICLRRFAQHTERL